MRFTLMPKEHTGVRGTSIFEAEMGKIQDFIKIREDGKIIEESMNLKDISSLGPVSKITRVQWNNGSEPVYIIDNFGLLAKVINGRNFVAINGHNKSGQEQELSIFNCDGTRRFKISNTQAINNKNETGNFLWFERPFIDAPNVFGVIFDCNRDNLMFRMDIDAMNGQVINARYTR